MMSNDKQMTYEELIKWRLKELVGVASLARLGHDIIKAKIVLKEVKPEKAVTEIIKDYTDKLSEVNWEKSKEIDYFNHCAKRRSRFKTGPNNKPVKPKAKIVALSEFVKPENNVYESNRINTSIIGIVTLRRNS